MTTQRYRYLVGDTRTGSIVEELPLSNVSFSAALNDGGSFSASAYVGDSASSIRDVKRLTTPRSNFVIVERGGLPVWAGPIWTRSYDSQSKIVQIGAGDFWTYVRRRVIRNTLTYTETEQFDIVRAIIDHIQDMTGGDVGITYNADDSGVTRDRTYYDYELKNAGEAIEQLSAVNDGFDFAFDLSWDGTDLVKKLTLSYPNRGRAWNETLLVFEFDRNSLGYTDNEDATRSANCVHVLGEGEGVNMKRTVLTDITSVDLGDILIDEVLTFSDAKEQATLEGHAQAFLQVASNPVRLPTFTLKPNIEPEFGAWVVGDHARFRTRDEWNVGGVDEIFRIVAYQMKVDNNGEELLDMTVGPVLDAT